jgi:hypothetical protein
MQLADLNYARAGLESVLTWEDGFTAADIERRLTGFRDSAEFARLAALDRPLLSQDLAAFRHLANLNLEYAEGTRPRPEVELPRLRGFASEIQALIEKEYR